MKIEVLTLKPNDCLVVTTDCILTFEQRAIVEAHIQQKFGHDKVAILDNGMTAVVVRKQSITT